MCLPTFISLKYILILTCSQCLGPSKFLHPNFIPFLISPMHITCPTHPILFNMTILITFYVTYKLWSSCNFFISYHFILLRSKYSSQKPLPSTLDVRSSLDFGDKVSLPHKTNSNKDTGFLLRPPHPDQLWGSPTLLSNGHFPRK